MSSDVLATSVSTLSALNAAIAAADQATTAGSYEIDLAAGANIELTGALNAINLHAGVTLDIEGEGATLNGANAQGVSDHQRGLFVYAGTVTIESLTIANAEAVGGSSGSGGGGAGLGGGLFVANDVVHGAASAGAVTLTNVNFSGDSAKGGSSGVSVLGGGGGGLGGDGYSGGGGVGTGANGASDGGASAGNGIVLGATPPQIVGGGGSGGGGFGGQLDVNWTGRGGYDAAWGGGVGVDLATQTNGGFGGGGGEGGVTPAGTFSWQSDSGGSGGFGGGGGAAFSSNSDLGAFAGAGGFGGGGGSDPWGGAQGGFGAGAGDFTQGGGGLGAGGDIFVQQGASLTILASAIAAGTVAGGSGAVNGSAFGSGIFLQGDETLDLGSSQATYSSLTISGVIADGAGSGGTGVGALAVYGQGQTLSFDTNTVKLTAANTFTGGVTIYGGALELGATGAAGTGAITFGVPPQNSYAKPEILVDSGVSFANAVAHFGADDAIEFVGLTYSASDFVTYVANAQNTGGVVKICAPGGAVLASFTVRGDYNRFNFRLEEAYDPTPGVTNITVSYRSTTTSDFSGNGLSDILWRNSSGDLNFWLDSPYGVTPQAVPLHSDWQVAGVGDFAGAGHDA